MKPSTIAKAFNEMALEIEKNGVAHGFRGFDEAPTRENIAIWAENLHSEITEFWEAYRSGLLFSLCDKADKMSEAGLPELKCAEEELADIVIRALDTAQALKLDIGRAILIKHEFNKTRPYRHGGKKA